MLGARQPKGSLAELLLTDDISFRKKGRMEDYESPFSKIEKLRNTKSLLEQKNEFTGRIPVSPLLELEKKTKTKENIVLQFKELQITANFEDIKPIPPLSELLQSRVTSTSSNTYTLEPDQYVDQYGFIVDSKTISQRSATLSKSDQQKWLQMITNWDSLSQDRKQKNKQRLRKSIPNHFRGKAWKAFAEVSKIKPELMKEYSKLCEMESPFSTQIHKDLSRSLPTHVLFQDSDGKGQKSLFNALNAYSILDTNVGYCQGMGFICAVFLLYMSEEDAFVMLYRIIKGYGIGGFFEPGFPLLFKCVFIHDNLLDTWLPRLSSHFKTLEIKANMYSFGWYTTLFVNSLDFSYIVRIYDLFLADGMNVLFRVSIAILKLMQKELLKCDFDGTLTRIKNLNTYLTVTPDELISCALEFTLSDKRMDKLSKEYNSVQ